MGLRSLVRPLFSFLPNIFFRLVFFYVDYLFCLPFFDDPLS